MKVIIVQNKKEGGACAAKLILNRIKKKKNTTFGLATGKTMIPLYKKLSGLYKRGEINFSRVRCFNLDEYIGFNKNDKKSNYRFIKKYFFRKVNIREENIFFLDGKASDPILECKKYEERIKKYGGIDLQILGIGINGHIGFNEPGSSFSSRTRKVMLRNETRHANAWLFGSFKRVPRYALTTGIETILSARKIVLLAFGKDKAAAVAATFKRATKQVPASVLQRHPNVTFIIDRAASANLRQKSH